MSATRNTADHTARDTTHDGMDRPAPERSRGFALFVATLTLPAVFALVVFFGAWAVSDEVYAAEARSGTAAEAGADEVAGWKSTLVGICPIH